VNDPPFLRCERFSILLCSGPGFYLWPIVHREVGIQRNAQLIELGMLLEKFQSLFVHLTVRATTM
jgi:hypothetical protein